MVLFCCLKHIGVLLVVSGETKGNSWSVTYKSSSTTSSELKYIDMVTYITWYAFVWSGFYWKLTEIPICTSSLMDYVVFFSLELSVPPLTSSITHNSSLLYESYSWTAEGTLLFFKLISIWISGCKILSLEVWLSTFLLLTCNDETGPVAKNTYVSFSPGDKGLCSWKWQVRVIVSFPCVSSIL